jgi:LmbE family N-acetylglucosaminyl deacetylase
MKNVLVLAPHPDDAEFGVGGAIHRMLFEGYAITVVVAVTGGYRRLDGTEIGGGTRLEEAKRAMQMLGRVELRMESWFKENEGDTTPQKDLIGKVEAVLWERPWEMVFVNLPSFNQDHRALYDAVLTAFRPVSRSLPARLCAYEYPGNSWGPATSGLGTMYVALNQVQLNAKLRALRCHVSQFSGRQGNHVSPEGAELLAKWRGSEIGVDYAERFNPLRWVI